MLPRGKACTLKRCVGPNRGGGSGNLEFFWAHPAERSAAQPAPVAVRTPLGFRTEVYATSWWITGQCGLLRRPYQEGEADAWEPAYTPTLLGAGGQRENGRDQIGRDVSRHGNDSYREQEWGHD